TPIFTVASYPDLRLELTTAEHHEEDAMAERTTSVNAALAGTIDLGGDLTVNRFGFGAMRLTGAGIWGEPADREECKRVLRRTLELGINMIDTANSYGPEVSERLIAETLYPYPDRSEEHTSELQSR